MAPDYLAPTFRIRCCGQEFPTAADAKRSRLYRYYYHDVITIMTMTMISNSYSYSNSNSNSTTTITTTATTATTAEARPSSRGNPRLSGFCRNTTTIVTLIL